MAVPKTLSDAGVSVGLARGYFRTQGLSLETTSIPTGAEMVSSLATGQLDVGLGAPSAGLFNAIGRGAAVKIVGDKGSTPPGFGFTALVVRKALVDRGAFRGAADLRGRTIALPGTGVVRQVDLARALERGDLTLDDANVVSMDFSNMLSALANGSIAAAFAIEPTVTRMVDEGIGVRWLGADELTPGQEVSAGLFAAGFGERRRAAAERFRVAYVRGVRDYNDAFRKGRGRDEIIQLLMDWTGLQEPRLYERRVPAGLDADGCPQPAALRSAYAWWLAHGQIQTPVDLDPVIDLSFCQHAVRVLGPYQE